MGSSSQKNSCLCGYTIPHYSKHKNLDAVVMFVLYSAFVWSLKDVHLEIACGTVNRETWHAAHQQMQGVLHRFLIAYAFHSEQHGHG